jgi:hypothetical protein
VVIFGPPSQSKGWRDQHIKNVDSWLRRIAKSVLARVARTKQPNFLEIFQERVKPGQLKTEFVTIIRDSRWLSGPRLVVERDLCLQT